VHCRRCNSELIDGKCPNCYDPFLEMQSQLRRQRNKYDKHNNILFIISIILFVISIFPLHQILMWIGLGLSILIFALIIVLQRKEKNSIQPYGLIFTCTSFLSFAMWLYFVYIIIS